ncbi:DKNYY family protein [Aquimarina spongiae]|uniref:DKNYY family protein n=2 Tax=Aquimarina spongiae TaxID=570521 RepID=A0A1M6D0K5_9FLAO|nr:DKNYY family protein [Aquimarina spongiae]
MVKKVLMTIAIIFFILISLLVYGVYRFFNPFGGLVNEEVSNSYFYTKDKEKIVYSPMGNWFELGKTEMEVDMSSFQVLGIDYAKDKENAYFKSRVIDFGIDVPSFRVLEGYVPLDKNHVYVLVDAYAYLDDTKTGFKILEDADPDTYEQLNYDFARDKNVIFRNNEKLTEIDHESFEIINGEFCKDQDGVYHYRYQKPLQKIDNINDHEVVSLTSYCIRDNQNLFFHLGSIQYEDTDEIASIPFEDPKQITFFEEKKWLKVGNKMYYEGEIHSEVDASSFEEVGYGYAKDAKHVFFLGEIIDGADPGTFKYDDIDYIFYDKNYVYEGGEKTRKR